MEADRGTPAHDGVTAWVNALPYDCREAVSMLRRQDPEQQTSETLQAAVVGHLEQARRELARNEFVDIAAAEKAARLAVRIAERIDRLSGAEREIGLLAVAYFVSPDDAEDDFSSPVGFDDDLQVLRAACHCLKSQPIEGGHQRERFDRFA